VKHAAIAMVFLLAAAAACGGKGKGPANPGSGSADDDTLTPGHEPGHTAGPGSVGSLVGPGSGAGPAETPIHQRRDAACEALGPRITACAVADAKRTMSPAELEKLDLDKTAPVHTRKFIEDCKSHEMSSRQVRVFEVCMKQETACDKLLACLDNANPKKAP
jgi:hypothetical protein